VNLNVEYRKVTLPPGATIQYYTCVEDPANCCLTGGSGSNSGGGPDPGGDPGNPVCACAECPGRMARRWTFDATGFAGDAVCLCTDLQTELVELVHDSECVFAATVGAVEWILEHDDANGLWVLYTTPAGCSERVVYYCQDENWHCDAANTMALLSSPCPSSPATILLEPVAFTGDCNDENDPIATDCCNVPLPRTLYVHFQDYADCACFEGLVVPIDYVGFSGGRHHWANTGTELCGTCSVRVTLTCGNNTGFHLQVECHSCNGLGLPCLTGGGLAIGPQILGGDLIGGLECDPVYLGFWFAMRGVRGTDCLPAGIPPSNTNCCTALGGSGIYTAGELIIFVTEEP